MNGSWAWHKIKRHRGTRALALVLLGAVLARCTLLGGTSDTPKKARNTKLAAPAGWRETDRGDSDEAYQLPSGSIATMNSDCSRESRAPLDILMKQLLFGLRNVKTLRAEPLTVAGGEALRHSVTATNEGVPFHLELVVVKKQGCIFDFSLVNPKAMTEAEIGQFLSFVKSFRYGKN